MNHIPFTTPVSLGDFRSAPQPFVGVCGVHTAADYRTLVTIAERQLPAGTDRFIMAGIKDIGDDLPAVVSSDMVRPFVHCDYSGQRPFEDIVARGLEYAYGFVRGLQLNVLPWMEVDFGPLWKRVKEQYPQVSLVLQAHQHIMEHYTPDAIAARLAGLPIDYILFDASQSRGIPYDLAVMRKYVAAVYEQALPVGVIVSGGLGPTNTMKRLFAPLVKAFPNLSCDAFLRIYDMEAGSLHWPAVESYVGGAGACLEATDIAGKASHLKV